MVSASQAMAADSNVELEQKKRWQFYECSLLLNICLKWSNSGQASELKKAVIDNDYQQVSYQLTGIIIMLGYCGYTAPPPPPPSQVTLGTHPPLSLHPTPNPGDTHSPPRPLLELQQPQKQCYPVCVFAWCDALER